MQRASVIVIGAGASGLAAAEALAAAGADVLLLEARDRVGGRIHTVQSRAGGFPIELGAEFIHGSKNCTWKFVRSAGLATTEVPDRHWQNGADGTEEKASGFWDRLENVFSNLDLRSADQSFASFLDRLRGVTSEEKTLARDFVEGFHAAQTDVIGTRALAKAEAAAEEAGGTRQFRICNGYGALLAWFVNRLSQLRVPLHLNTTVLALRWKPGAVEVAARVSKRDQIFRAEHAVVTVPLGVLKAPGGLRFEPDLPDKREAISCLAMGSVFKLTLEFRHKFWPVENFGFLHIPGAPFPTWWSDERGPVLTAWAGGPQAERLYHISDKTVRTQAISLLAESFKLLPTEIEQLVVASHTHPWSRDEFSRRAYSYVPVGMMQMPSRLAAPVENTLFFAGEATDSNGDQGTVHGALRSGIRAAQEVLRSPSHLSTAA